MSDKRIIKVNPELFNISNTTRKKREKNNINKENKEIKVKQKTANNQTMKRKLLNLIRDKQDEKLKKEKQPIHVKTHVNDFKSDFNESLEYLDNLSKNPTIKKNYTIKNRNYENKNEVFNNSLHLNDNQKELNFNNSSTYNMKTQEQPKYGCLKNGTLPTYKQYIKNTTQKNYDSINEKEESIVNTNNSLENAKIVNEFKQNQNLLKKEKPPQKLRKKTVRRNFTIGRSKKIPKISVLISNKTIRKNISTKKTLLQQTPLSEVKRFLIKRGLIKIGSIAPNDVLRKMYECASMLCGEVKNHNKENLLYNFFNYNED